MKGVSEFIKILKLENLFLKDVAISQKRRIWFYFLKKRKQGSFFCRGGLILSNTDYLTSDHSKL